MNVRSMLTFDTTHHALWAEDVARESGIPAEIVPAPPAAHARCDLALEYFVEDGERLRQALRAEGVSFGEWAGGG